MLVQLLPAHLIRELKFLAEHLGTRNESYGLRVLDKTRALFDVIHRRHPMKPETGKATLKILGKVLCQTAAKEVPGTAKAMTLARRLKKGGETSVRFITTRGI